MAKVYPNPAQNSLNIDATESTTIHIVDLLGKTIYTQQLNLGANTIDICSLTNGVYMLQTEKGETIKFVKE